MSVGVSGHLFDDAMYGALGGENADFEHVACHVTGQMV